MGSDKSRFKKNSDCKAGLKVPVHIHFINGCGLTRIGVKAQRGTGGDIKEFTEFRHSYEVIRFNGGES